MNITYIIGALIAYIVIRLIFNKKHTRLIKYEPEQYTALSAHSWTYILTLEKTSWNGRFKKEQRIKMEVPFRADLKSYHDLWDLKIKSGENIK